MSTFQDDLNFLEESNYAIAFVQDASRVRALLVHQSVDMRLAAIKSVLAHPNDERVRELISLFITDASWVSDGLTPASRWIAPQLNESHGELLADCFPEIAQRNSYCFQLFCRNCNSPILQNKLKMVLFDDLASCEQCQLAIKCLSVYGLDQTNIWNRCLDHRCKTVARTAKIYLRIHLENA
ncbi:hypothetical protein N9Y42_09000 [Mariniblastus sp.]|nr:hypothetical protein [Mariniblastus sp.]